MFIVDGIKFADTVSPHSLKCLTPRTVATRQSRQYLLFDVDGWGDGGRRGGMGGGEGGRWVIPPRKHKFERGLLSRLTI